MKTLSSIFVMLVLILLVGVVREPHVPLVALSTVMMAPSVGISLGIEAPEALRRTEVGSLFDG
jgi:hypothetical protein